MPDDAIDLLLAQHGRIETLFLELTTASRAERAEVFDELVRLLSVHETAEEELIHPLARAADEADGAVVDARLEEEREAKRQLKRLVELGVEAPEFNERLAALRQAVLAHATYEERYEFPRLRARHADTLVSLVPVVQAAEKMAPTRPHPGTESATVNVLAGPLLAVVDRTRDAIRAVRS